MSFRAFPRATLVSFRQTFKTFTDMKNAKVDDYLEEGCGRCPLGKTPDCKVHRWPMELEALRALVLECGLTEEIKWGVPCYTVNGGNVLIVAAFNDNCTLSFFKGSLLDDPAGILQKPGENTQAGRVVRFTSPEEIEKLRPILKAYVFAAVDAEKAGLKVEFAKNPEPIPEELEAKFDEDPVFRSAFYALTPGRQRGYILHFSQSKQPQTRVSRIEKCMPQIMAGIGLHDHYGKGKRSS